MLQLSASLLLVVVIVFIFLVPEEVKDELRHVPILLGYLMILVHFLLWFFHSL